MNYIRAKRADTRLAWLNSIFLVTHLLILLRLFFALCKTGIVPLLSAPAEDWGAYSRQYEEA